MNWEIAADISTVIASGVVVIALILAWFCSSLSGGRLKLIVIPQSGMLS